VMVALGMGVLWCEIRILDWMLEPSDPTATVAALPSTAGHAA